MNEDCTFFWKGPLSQWYKSPFLVAGVKFNCAEQYMMYSKATLFEDYEMANRILATSNPREQQALGRQVRNFDLTRWNANAAYFVYIGNYHKFFQSKELLDILFATGDNLLVEASPVDKIWGIGLDEDAAKITPKAQWPGTNWLGLVLTQVRIDLRKDFPDAICD